MDEIIKRMKQIAQYHTPLMESKCEGKECDEVEEEDTEEPEDGESEVDESLDSLAEWYLTKASAKLGTGSDFDVLAGKLEEAAKKNPGGLMAWLEKKKAGKKDNKKKDDKKKDDVKEATDVGNAGKATKSTQKTGQYSGSAMSTDAGKNKANTNKPSLTSNPKTRLSNGSKKPLSQMGGVNANGEQSISEKKEGKRFDNLVSKIKEKEKVTDKKEKEEKKKTDESMEYMGFKIQEQNVNTYADNVDEVLRLAGIKKQNPFNTNK